MTDEKFSPTSAFSAVKNSSVKPTKKRKIRDSPESTVDMDEILKCVRGNSNKLDTILAEQEKLRNDITGLKNETTKNSAAILKNSCATERLEARLNEFEQRDLKLHMDISGLSVDATECNSIKNVVLTLLAKYNIKCPSTAIDRSSVRYVTSKNVKMPIVVVVFSNYDEKMNVMRSKRENDPKSLDKIYFNHTLTQHNRNLLNAAKNVTRDIAATTYFADGHIFMKKENEPKGLCIKSMEDIEKFKRLINKATEKADGVRDVFSNQMGETEGGKY